MLSVYITAGFPQLESAPELASVLQNAGVDFIEMGIPFSDPIADGPTIQASSFAALQNGMTFRLALEQVRQIRKQNDLPIVVMGYLNPILQFGFKNLASAAQDVGIDGLIVPDLLPEDYGRMGRPLQDSPLAVNFLVSQNSAGDRVQAIDKLGGAFIYCVSVTGVTGARRGVPAGLLNFLDDLRKSTEQAVMVGFGISNGPDAAEIARHCEGVIVGSAVIKLLSGTERFDKKLENVQTFVKELKSALGGVKHGN